MSMLSPPAAPSANGDGHLDPGSGPARPVRPLGTRPAAVQPRAILGALLIVLAAVGTYVAIASAQQGPMTSFVVARNALDPGSVISADDVVVKTGDLPGDVQAQTFDVAEDLIGATVLAPMLPNDLFLRGAVRGSNVAPGSGADAQPMREVALPVDASQAGGRVRPGDFVDVIAVRGSGDTISTTVVARRVRVLAVPGGDDGIGSTGKSVLTLAVDSEAQACALAEVMHNDKLSVVRVTGVPTSTPTPTPSTCAPAPGGVTTTTVHPLAFLTTTTVDAPPTEAPAPETTRSTRPAATTARPTGTRP